MGICHSFCEDTKYTTQFVSWSKNKGSRVVTSSFTVSGEGSVLANSPILQTKSYFEVKVVEEGSFCIGVASARKGKTLNSALSDKKGAYVITCSRENTKVGDVIGVTYDMSGIKSVLSFYHNDHEMLEHSIIDIKGEIFPAVSVSDGATLEANFGQLAFEHDQADQDFEPIIFSRDLI